MGGILGSGILILVGLEGSLRSNQGAIRFREDMEKTSVRIQVPVHCQRKRRKGSEDNGV